MSNTKRITLCALFIALSFVGASIKVFGTIAFDSLPAFLATLALGFAGGGVVAFLGHMLTALTSGFPFGIVVHLIIAVGMVITMCVFYTVNDFLARRGVNWIICMVASCVLASVVNGPVMLLFLVPLLGMEVCLAMAVPLFVVALINSVLGSAVYEALVKARVLAKRGVANVDI